MLSAIDLREREQLSLHDDESDRVRSVSKAEEEVLRCEHFGVRVAAAIEALTRTKALREEETRHDYAGPLRVRREFGMDWQRRGRA